MKDKNISMSIRASGDESDKFRQAAQDTAERGSDLKNAIMQATLALILEKGDKVNEITVREISKKAGVGLGLINYHFGNKDRLIELCIECMINDTVAEFHSIKSKMKELSPFETLEFLGNTTLTFLFEHYAISKNSILTDLVNPKKYDNTSRTFQAYLPLVVACRPEWNDAKIQRKTFELISSIQCMVLRHEEILRTQGIDLTKAEQRNKFHSDILHDILEMV